MVTNNNKVEQKIFEAVNKRFEKIGKSYQKFHNNPYVPEHVHRFRVNMRKMRALLNFLKPVIGEGIYDEANQILRDIGRKLSPLRDLDSLIEECTEIAYNHPNLANNYADIFRFFEKERMKLIKQVSTKKVFEEVETKLTVTEEMIKNFELNVDDIRDFVSNRYNHKVTKLEKLADELDKEDYEDVHDVRKQAKKVRYTSSSLKKVLPKDERKSAKKNAKKIQNKLGEITDFYTMIELLEEYKEKTSNNNLKKSFDKLIEYHSN